MQPLCFRAVCYSWYQAAVWVQQVSSCKKEILGIDIFQVLISYYNILVFFQSVSSRRSIHTVLYNLRMAPDLELNLGGDFSFLQLLYSALGLAKRKQNVLCSADESFCIICTFSSLYLRSLSNAQIRLWEKINTLFIQLFITAYCL